MGMVDLNIWPHMELIHGVSVGGLVNILEDYHTRFVWTHMITPGSSGSFYFFVFVKYLFNLKLFKLNRCLYFRFFTQILNSNKIRLPIPFEKLLLAILMNRFEETL